MIERKENRLPDHYMYHVTENKGGKSFFTRIAAGWDNKDGEGISWDWELQPNGRTVSRTRASVDARRKRVETLDGEHVNATE